MRILLGTAVMVLTYVAQAAATNETGPVRVPEPTTLALLSAGAAALTIGTRWFRRK